MSFEDLKREALKLSYDEREELTYALYASLAEEEDLSESELPAEVRRRYQAIKEGKTKLLSGEEVFAELFAEKPL
jgi:putative addiction module component (TIGR02574 family)